MTWHRPLPQVLCAAAAALLVLPATYWALAVRRWPVPARELVPGAKKARAGAPPSADGDAGGDGDGDIESAADDDDGQGEDALADAATVYRALRDHRLRDPEP